MSEIRAESIQPTRLFLEREGRLFQSVSVAFESPPVHPIQVTAGKEVLQIMPEQLQRYCSRWLVPVPVVDQETETRLESPEIGAATVLVKPERRWKVYITPHTHLDVGFTEHQDQVWARMNRDLSNVIRLCEETRDWPEGSQFRWTLEVSGLLESFLKQATPEEADNLVQLLREGRIELCGMYLNLLTELCGPEELCRSFYPIQRFRDRYNIPVDTAMINDIPGYTWCLPALLKESGIQFLSLRANSVRGKFLWWRPGAVERPFLWEAPNGERILTWYTDSYRETNGFRGGYNEDLWTRIETEMQKPGAYQVVLDTIQRAIDTGYQLDAIQMRMGGDNLESVITPCYYVREWNRRFAYPKLIMSTNRDFYKALLPSVDRLPVRRGDIPDWWADGAASTALETGKVRIQHDRLLDLEKLAVMADLLGGREWDYPSDEIHEAYRQILLYDEHTWGSHWSGRTSHPEEAERQWITKRGYIEEAETIINAITDRIIQRLSVCIPSPKAGTLLFNTLSWPRERSTIHQYHFPQSGEQSEPLWGLDIAEPSGVEIPRLESEIPAFGYSFIPEGDEKEQPEAVEADKDRDLDEMLLIALNGAAPILDPASIQEFNQYIYESGGLREKINPHTDPPEKVHPLKKYAYGARKTTTNVIMFPEQSRYSATVEGEKVISLRQDYDFTPGALLIRNTLNKEDILDPEGVYFSFPFRLNKPSVHVEIPFGYMRPGADQLPYSAHDFYSVHHWVDLNDGEKGITFIALEAPLVMFGAIRSDAWLDSLKIENGHLYSYIMNNYWFTNYRFHQGGKTRFHYAIIPYQGAFNPARAVRQGWEVASPVYGIRPDIHDSEKNSARKPFKDRTALLSVEPSSVILLAVKRAEDGRGYIIRLFESAGHRTECSLKWDSSYEFDVIQTNLVEKDQRELKVKGREIRMNMEPYGIRTLRLVERT